MTDTETHQSDPGLTFGAVYRIEWRFGDFFGGTWRLIRIDEGGRLVLSRLCDHVLCKHPLDSNVPLRFVEVR